MSKADDYLMDEGHRTMKDATLNTTLNTTFISICKNKTYGDVFSEAAFQNNHYFLLCAILALNGIYFFLVVLFYWRIKAFREIKYCFPRLRKHFGLTLGTFSFVFCEKVISTEEFCPSALGLVFVCSALSVLALLVAFGTKEKPHCLIPCFVTSFALGILVGSIVKRSEAQPGQDFVPLSIYALNHVAMGLILFNMYIREDAVTGQQWHLRNGNLHRMEEGLL